MISDPAGGRPPVLMIKVSVLIITYNHAPFIAQAIESALMQRTSFDYEIVIGEDCSTDGTREIVRSYAQTHPDRIRPVFHKHNLGGSANGQATLPACRGEYVAILEGDDYWVSDRKLEKQVALLEGRPGSAGCFANSIVVDDAGNVISPDFFAYYGSQTKPEIRTEDIVPFGLSPANTVIFKREVLSNAPKWYRRYPTHCGMDLLISLNGPYLFLNEAVGAYRLHPGSNWSSRSLPYQVSINLRYLKNLYDDELIRREYGAVIRESVEAHLNNLFTNTGSLRERAEVLRHFIKFLAAPPWNRELIVTGTERFYRRFVNTARRRLRPSA